MNEKNYVVNIKNKAGTIFTFRGDTAEELEQALLGFVQQDLSTTIVDLESLIMNAKTVLVQQHVGGAVVGEYPLDNFAPVPPAGVAPIAPVAIGATSGRACVHGSMTKREGTGQWGPYKAYYCPTAKGTADQCKPVYIKPTDAEWATF